MSGAPPSLEGARVFAQLRTQRYGRSLDLRHVTDSTNDDARQAALGGAPNGHVVVADAQRHGRGSQGRDWSSPHGEDLYLSIVDRPSVAFAALPPLTLAVGLGVAEAVDALRGDAGAAAPSRVKWPNDVQIDRKKCAGILIEATASGGGELQSLVIGIGLNVNRTEFPSELSALATSLRLQHAQQRPLDRTAALCTLLDHVERWVDRFAQEGAESVTRALASRLALLGERASCGEVRGIVRGVSPGGALRMETEHGVREIIAGRLLPDPLA
ncbi:MAG TPA: biotin--[acetyl-CoA-carboxylase] ligase [Polyangiales bacterium]|jgi:BirA family biotin operon repressor/biotin-[acetyl-CoA-carboxylase] ligase|nr:biotin--[acetyl-CoA-carboxylase] ligase [Polyangiales bacterium]